MKPPMYVGPPSVRWHPCVHARRVDIPDNYGFGAEGAAKLERAVAEADRVTPGGAGFGSAAVYTSAPIKKRFYGMISLDPIKAKMDFATLMDEVVQQFTAKLGVEVKLSVEIEAWSKEGFDEMLQRTIKENCNVLRFGSAEFEEN